MRAMTLRLRSARWLLVALMSTAVLAAACGGGSSSKSSSSSKGTITIGYWPGVNQLGIIKDKHWLEDMGYTVKWQQFLKFLPAASQAMIAGSIDVTLGNTTQAVSLFAKQPNLGYVVGQLTTNDPAIVARKGSGITSVKQLHGRKVATTGVSTANHLALLLALAKAGIKPGTENNQYIQTGTTTVSALFQRNAVDAAETFVPFSTTLVQEGQGTLLTTGDQAAGRPFPSNGLIASRAYTKAHPQAIVDLLKTVQKANAYIKSNPSDSNKILAKFSNVKPGIIKAAFASGQPKIASVVPSVNDHLALVQAELKYGLHTDKTVVDFTKTFVHPELAKKATQ